MILAKLRDYYLTLESVNRVPTFGYSDEKISFVVVLGVDGALVDIQDLRVESKGKFIPELRSVPAPVKRTSGVKSQFLWDKTAYVFGYQEKKEKPNKNSKVKEKFLVPCARGEHNAFKEFHRLLLGSCDDAGAVALLAFLDRWSPESFVTLEQSQEIVDTNLVFRLDGELEYLHERPVMRQLWVRHFQPDDDLQSGRCLVTGEAGPVERLHPNIKGVRDAQSSGVAFVSFNQQSFASYLKCQADNAPVSKAAAFGYSTALNHMLRKDAHHRQCLDVLGSTVVYWAAPPDGDINGAQIYEDVFQAFFESPPEEAEETDKLRDVLRQIVRGQFLVDAQNPLHESTKFYVLGLAPNAGRVSVRFWLESTFGQLVQNLARHFGDLAVEPNPWRYPPSIDSLVKELGRLSAKGGADWKNISPKLVGELATSVLTGRRYPRTLLTSAIARMRADGAVTGGRVALCKAVLVRDKRLGALQDNKEVPVSLDRDTKDPAYRLGRLFAELESVQRAALGKQINATIRDRYYGAASATPASVFPMLIRNAMHHLSKLNKDESKRGLAIYFERAIEEILSGLETRFPKSFAMEDQGRFALGYYHQRYSRAAAEDARPEVDTTDDMEGGE